MRIATLWGFVLIHTLRWHGFIMYVMWAAKPLYFMEENVYHILTVFNQLFIPATEDNYTDQFTSREIKKMVEDHLGLEIALSEIHNTMRDLKFNYIMQDNEFVWLVQKL